MEFCQEVKRSRFHIEPLEERIAPKKAVAVSTADLSADTSTAEPTVVGDATYYPTDWWYDPYQSNPFDPNYYDFGWSGGWSGW